MKNKYIAIEGNIGVGKTTLAKFLANHFNGSLLLEEFAENKFLKLFYQTKDYAFHSEMQFLLDRSLQMNTFFDQDHPIVFSDFHIEKSLVFSKMNLSKSNYSMIENVHQSLFQKFPKPDVLIFLDSDVHQISKNIKSRNRDFEKDLGHDYLESLTKNYNFWLNKSRIPVIKLGAKSISYDNEELLLKNLSALLKSYLS
jgi:deoxyguanosine kinase|tara:strand:+ start:1752 stop:2345 length:594 start_codon:yes stop_codon:yes gene_type:complete